MSGGKGGKSTTTQDSNAIQETPGFQEALGIRAIEQADALAGLGPIRQRGPTVAAFNDFQNANFQNAADLAGAFGMQAPTNVMSSMPQASDFGGGVMGYSASPVVDNMLAELQREAPAQYDAMTGMYMDPVTGQRPTEGPFSPVTPGILQAILDNYEDLRITRDNLEG